MARINIEDSLYKDHRFFELLQKLGSTDAALGAVVRAWTVAQEYWIANGVGIPLPVWKKQKLRPELIEVGLAEERGEFIYVCGSEMQFAWMTLKIKAGRTGGRVSAQRPRDEKGQLLPKGACVEIIDKTIQAESKRNPSSAKPLALALTLTQKKEEYIDRKPTTFSKSGVFDLELAYKKFPRKEGKSKGLKKLTSEIKSEASFNQLLLAVENYAASRRNQDQKFTKHFSSFVSEWRDWIDWAPPQEKAPFLFVPEEDQENF
jgi:hypothetical protein